MTENLSQLNKQEQLWHHRTRKFVIYGGPSFLAGGVLHHFFANENIRTAAGSLVLFGCLCIIGAIISTFFHYNKFIKARKEEGLTKKEAAREYHRRFPSSE